MKEMDGNFTYIDDVDNEKDLGVTFESNLKFERHITNIVNKAQRILGLIFRSFETLDEEMFIILYKSLVRPCLEYGTCVWSPYLKKDILRIERVQRRATKLVKGIARFSYEERLLRLGLPTLEYRRHRYDMLQVYKSLHNFDEMKWENMFTFTTSDLRGHHLKLVKNKCGTNQRLYSFSQRVVSMWNNLPPEVVESGSVNIFKSQLNKVNWNKYKFRSSAISMRT